MSNEYLRAFVIGSSCLVFLPYFYAVSHFRPEKFNFDYVTYTFLAPIGLGFMNLLSLIFAKIFHFSRKIRYLLTSVLAPTFVLFMVYMLSVYNYTTNEWINHAITLYVFYFLIVNFILYNLDKYV